MSSELDDKLGAILEIVKKSIEAPKKDTGTSGTVTQPSAASSTTSSYTKNTEDTTKLQELIAKEMMYHQLLPPVTPALAQKVERNARECIRALKALARSPVLQKKFSNLLIPLIESEKERGDRSTSPDAELKGIINEVLTEASNTTGERIVPFVIAIGYISAGATVGAAAGIIGHKIYDALFD